jgi:hypothetical protein
MEKDYGIPEFTKVGAVLAEYLAAGSETTITNFVFILPKVPNAVYFCTSVSLPGMTCNELVYKSGRGIAYKVPGSEVVHGELTFTYLVDEKMKNYQELQQWFRTMTAFRDFNDVASINNWMSEEGQLIILSSKKNPKVRITFRGLFPSKLSGVTFNSADVEANTLTATCNMNFTYYNIEVLDG